MTQLFRPIKPFDHRDAPSAAHGMLCDKVIDAWQAAGVSSCPAEPFDSTVPGMIAVHKTARLLHRPWFAATILLALAALRTTPAVAVAAEGPGLAAAEYHLFLVAGRATRRGISARPARD